MKNLPRPFVELIKIAARCAIIVLGLACLLVELFKCLCELIAEPIKKFSEDEFWRSNGK